MEEKTSSDTSIISLSGEVYKPINITPDNISGLLSDRMKNNGVEDGLVERSLELLENHV